MARTLINAAKQVLDSSVTLNLLEQSVQDSLIQVETNKTDIAAIIASEGSANGIATLDANAKLPTSQLPALALGDTVTVASEVAKLALTTTQVQNGDVVVVDTGNVLTNKTYRVVDDTQLGVEAGYRQLLFPEEGVESILRNGVAQRGQVALTEIAFTGASADASFSDVTYTATNASDALIEVRGIADTNTSTISTIETDVAAKLNSSDLKKYVIPTGVIDGVNKDFVLAEAPAAGTLQFVWNGQEIKPTDDFTVSGTTVTMVGSPDAGDAVWAHYVAA